MSPSSGCPPTPSSATSRRPGRPAASITSPNPSPTTRSPSSSASPGPCPLARGQGSGVRSQPPSQPLTPDPRPLTPASSDMRFLLNTLLARLLVGSAVTLVLFAAVGLVAALVIDRLLGALRWERNTHLVL